MHELPYSIIITIAVLTVFLGFITVLKYAVQNTFARNRLIMTSFFFFIIATLTISFWKFTLDTLPFTIPAWIAGIVVGWLIGARGADARLESEGLEHYVEHFAHVDIHGLKDLTWWSVLNFYTVASALVLINLVGLSTVIFRGAENWAIATSTAGAFLLGTIIPYLIHLWSIKVVQSDSTTSSE